MKTIVATLLATLTVGGLFYMNTRSPSNTDYDMYVFAVQWGKTMCLDGSKDVCPEKLPAIPNNKISIHGLWPNLQSGKYLPDCNQGTEIEVVDDGSEMFETMKKYWVSLANTDEYFWTHEFNKHGYCYSTDYKEYFQTALDVFFDKNIPDIITDIWGEQTGDFVVPYDEFVSKLNERFGGQFYTPKCKKYNGKYYLNEIRIALDLDFNYIEAKLGNSCNSKYDVVIPYW